MTIMQTAPYKTQGLDWKIWAPKRGEIYLLNLGNEKSNIDSEQRGTRPFVILSNNVGNTMSTIITGAPISTRKKHLPKLHVPVGKESGLKMQSYILTEHIRTISKRRFFVNGNIIFLGQLKKDKIIEVENTIKFTLGFQAS